MPGAWRWATMSLVAVAVLLGACASKQSCAPVPPSAACPDLTLSGNGYAEWREFYGPPIAELQEFGDASYPACNVQKGCPGSEFSGFGATDVWVLPGVDVRDAVIGLRENSDVRVIFMRIGVQPENLPLPS